MSSVTLNGTTYTDSQFLAYGYVGLFPEGIFTNLLAELNARLAATPTITTMATNSILGRISGGSGAVEVLSAANVKTILGFDSIAPLTTIAESWIGPSSTTGIYFKGGNVGIGTTGPGTLLHINNVADSNFFTISQGADYKHSFYNFFSDADSRLDFKIASGAGTQVNVMTLKGNGNVGIGTTSPSAKLAINGGLHVGGDSDPGDNNAIIDGTLSTGALTTNLGLQTAGAADSGGTGYKLVRVPN